MTDFKKAFNIGINSAEKAAKNRQQVDEVFAELNRQLTEVSDGKLVVDITNEAETDDKFLGGTLGSLATILAASNNTQLNIPKIISAKNIKAEKCGYKKLAGWKQDRAGYPCVISYGNKEFYCDDKEALESSLSDLLQDPTVGDTLHKLMLLPEKKGNA